MNLNLNPKIAESYSSLSQKIRVITEDWVDSQIFCPSCGFNIENFKNNRPVADFYCPNCNEEFELKSKKEIIGNKIVDGAYSTMIQRLQSKNNPNFFLLNYSLVNWNIINFFVIPKHFFVPANIEKRKPLSQTARRAGWMGCNILLQNIPRTGKIFFVKEGKIKSKKDILNDWQKTIFLIQEKEIKNKGWILDIMNCIDRLGKKEFSLQEIYNFENSLKLKYPNNKHIKDKIRQQLQFLRDKGYLIFKGKGIYKLGF